MKKVLSLVAVMAVLLVALTGCVSINYEVSLNKDGTADVAYVYGFEKETLEQLETNAEEMTSDMKKNAEENDYEIETYSDDKIEGFKAKKHIENIEEISFEKSFGSDNVKDSDENRIKIEKKGTKTVYSQNANIDLSSIDDSMNSMLTIKYVIKLPVKVGNNNANEVSEDGKTLTWNLKAGEVNEVTFEATSNPLALVGIVIIVLIIIAGVAVLIIRKTKTVSSSATIVNSEKEENKETNAKEDKKEE